MSQPVHTPSLRTQYAPAADYCRLTPEEEDDQIDNWPSCLLRENGTATNCHYVVKVGLFFDGTNNNMKRDYYGMPPEKRCHSNIVRLYFAHPDVEDNNQRGSFQYFRFYMPGVGTPFPEIGEDKETQDGKAFAKGGQARILWAVLQVYNAVHATVYKGLPMLDEEEMKTLIQDYENKVYHQQRPNPEDPPLRRRDWFQPLTDRLSQKLRERLLARQLPSVPLVSLSVFGFSRGAVEARAFCYWYQDVLQDGRFLGTIDTEIKFLGLFDSVASVGPPASMHEQFGLWMLSGHSAWAAEILQPLPALVRKTVHLMAAHEVRMNFPLTRVTGSNVEEWLFPGVHSDVGGGYVPGAQGRSRGGHASLLSQIPLLHMYRAALTHGVPFVRFEKMAERVRRDFEVSPQLMSAFNLYLQCLKAGEATDYRTLVCKHMLLYYRWRARMMQYRGPAISAYATDPQDKQDLEESDTRMRWDLQLLELRAVPNAMRNERGGLALSPQERAGANQYPVTLAELGYPLTPWEHWVLKIFNAPLETRQFPHWSEDVLLADYVHDSFAGFYLAGAMTEFDREEEFHRMCEALAEGERLNSFQQRLYNVNPYWADAQAQAIRDGKKPPKPDKPLVFPVMTDDDAPALRVAAVRLATNTRREGGGYFRQRWVFMKKVESDGWENEAERTTPATE
ncbi:T6SS phospholipase effector Tle1-like catalytic domain-containing protein [Cupriavidus sp. NPDC089707]|uniref:T6SS phospholipase effector Tle1-like catalytic domain-containing protein n=1 Tax=Cupriavidus sp. NPDC089707 TaxID=3363963 RepID=UPI0037F390B9